MFCIAKQVLKTFSNHTFVILHNPLKTGMTSTFTNEKAYSHLKYLLIFTCLLRNSTLEASYLLMETSQFLCWIFYFH